MPVSPVFVATKTCTMKKPLLLLALFCLSISAFANDEDSAKILKERIAFFTDSINKSMTWEHGSINIADGAVKINVPEGFKFLNAKQSQYILEDMWGNLPDNSVLGMVFPENVQPMGDSIWAFVITFDKMGFVKDGDADDM